MKIAQIAPLIESVPPKKYGGTERIVYLITEELVKRGHEVTLFASGDSLTSAKLISTYPIALRHAFPFDPVSKAIFSNIHLLNAYSHQEEFDIIHDHTIHYGAPFAQKSKTPVVMTLHGALNQTAKSIFNQYRNPGLVSISKVQQSFAPHLEYLGSVYNGLDFSQYPEPQKQEKYLLFVGRICPEKGVHLAIEVAEKTGLPLIIAAKYEPSVAEEYFETKIKPKLSRKIKWIGEVDEVLRNQLFSKALATLHPVTWPEPFGLTLIEAMACGSPVIAFRQGSIPEVLHNTQTGFVVEDVDEMVEAVKKIETIDRAYCKLYARTKFSLQRMVDGYELMYKKLLTQKVFPSEDIWRFAHQYRLKRV